MILNIFRKYHTSILVIATVAGFALIVFGALLGPEVCIFTTDNNLGQTAQAHRIFPDYIFGCWNDFSILGLPSAGVLNLTGIVCGLLPPRIYMNWIHATYLIGGSLFLWLFLKEKHIKITGCLLGMLTLYWLGNNFTLIYAGHDGKFAAMMLAAAALWCIEKGMSVCRWEWGVIAGGIVGGMFLEQLDVALFVAMFIAAYAIFSIVNYKGWHVRPLLAGLLPMGLMVILVGGGGVLVGYTANVKGVAAMAPENPQALWEYCTQWSEPPDETIEYIAPGYMGWRSGEPEGPYWGRSGRSAEWDTTRQGFMNFRLEAQYIGAIPFWFALFALVAAVFGKKTGYGSQVSEVGQVGLQGEGGRWRKRRADILFWGVAALLAMLLSFGKYFPLYALFYKLPLVSTIRNPVKFIHVFQLALGILAAYGLDLAMDFRAGWVARPSRSEK